MEKLSPFYVIKLKECLSSRQKENPQYSLRAFARDIGINPGTLVKIFKGERVLPSRLANKVLDSLNLTPSDRISFMDSLLRKKVSIDSIKIDSVDSSFIIPQTHYKVIGEWEHLAVNSLFDVRYFKATTEDIAHRFSISINRAEEVVQNLMECGLLKKNDEGKLIRIYEEIKTAEDSDSRALKEFHIHSLKMGIEKIEVLDLKLRDFSSMVVAIDLEQVPEAKTIIREFHQKLKTLLKNSGNKTEVFQLSIQFYPLTNVGIRS